MSEENKKTEAENKIMSFHISDEEMQDSDMDRYVREGLIREADELEAEMNRRADLAEIEAPSSMFSSIVRRLKEQGLWEEDAPGSETVQESSADAPGSETAKEPSVDAPGPETVQDLSADMRGSETVREPSVDAMDAKVVPEESGIPQEKPETEADEEYLAALYAQLPQEDQEALALGRELVQKRENKMRKRRRRRKILKISGIAAACLALVFGVSMTSEANRRLVKRFWDGLMMNLGFMVHTDYTGDNETIRSKTKEEIEAMEEIQKQQGSPTIDFTYLPAGMEFQGYEIMDGCEAVLFYSYHDSLFYVTIVNVEQEGVYYYKYDNEAAFLETVTSYFGLEAEIWEVNQDMEEETYIAEINYNDWRYVLNGMLSIEELRKIIKNLYIL